MILALKSSCFSCSVQNIRLHVNIYIKIIVFNHTHKHMILNPSSSYLCYHIAQSSAEIHLQPLVNHVRYYSSSLKFFSINSASYIVYSTYSK